MDSIQRTILNNSIKNGDFGSLNAETLTKLTQGFLDDEDAEMYLRDMHYLINSVINFMREEKKIDHPPNPT